MESAGKDKVVPSRRRPRGPVTGSAGDGPHPVPSGPYGQARGPMFQVERRERIMQRLLREGRVDVTDLAESFDVTGETIRRDLTDLQRERLVRRVHGGAIPGRGTAVVRGSTCAKASTSIEADASPRGDGRGTRPRLVIIDSGSTALHLPISSTGSGTSRISNRSPSPLPRALTRSPHVSSLVVRSSARRWPWSMRPAWRCC